MNKKLLLLSALALIGLSLGGCATGARSTAMQIYLPVVAKEHPETVSVTVSGGKETNPLWTSQVSDADFQTALVETIRTTRVFSAILPGSEGDLLLEVQLVKLQQPLFGMSFTVTAETKWRLRNRVDGQLVWEQSITQAHTATMSDTLYGVKRLKLANEGAIQAVIKVGVEELSRLRLK